MDEFIKSATTTTWWISVVAVGIAINILSAWLFKHGGGRMAKMSSWYRNRSEQSRRQYLQQVEALSQDPASLVLVSVKEARLRLNAIMNMTYTLLFVLLFIAMTLHGGFSGLERTVVSVSGLLFLFSAASLYVTAIDTGSMLDDIHQMQLDRSSQYGATEANQPSSSAPATKEPAALN